VSLTQPQLLAAVADRAELSKSDTKRVLGALEGLSSMSLGMRRKIRIGGLVQLTVRVKPGQKKRQDRTRHRRGDHGCRQAGHVDVRARPLARAKQALPSVQKARRRLAA
jgi:nucleoid DNA-binding protein